MLINKIIATFQFPYVLKYLLLFLVRQKLKNNSSWFIDVRLSFWAMCSLYINVFEAQLHTTAMFYLSITNSLLRCIQDLFGYCKTLIFTWFTSFTSFLPSLLKRSRLIRDCFSDHIFLFPDFRFGLVIF